MREGTDDVTELPTHSDRPIQVTQQFGQLRSSSALTLPKVEDVQALLPDAAIEFVGGRRELVIYTGWTVHSDGETLAPMDGERD